MIQLLDSLCSIGIAQRATETTAWLEDLESVAACTGIGEFVARAYLHRKDFGDDGAREATRTLAAEIETLRYIASLG